MTNNSSSYLQSHTWKEILSEGTVWQQVLEELSGSAVIDSILAQGHKRREWIFVGCGTSYYLAESAAYSWTLLTGQPARALPGSEVLLFPRIVQAEGEEIQAVVISRSGKTSEAVRSAAALSKDLKVPTIGITCAENSELSKECDITIVLATADEQSMVMTRSFTSMLIALQYLAARQMKNAAFIADLWKMAEEFAPRIAGIGEQMQEFVRTHSFADYVFLGQGACHGLARAQERGCQEPVRLANGSCSGRLAARRSPAGLASHDSQRLKNHKDQLEGTDDHRLLSLAHASAVLQRSVERRI
jgi:glucosamine--fructose-6-phosphate aminotransferase (isomerizing)